MAKRGKAAKRKKAAKKSKSIDNLHYLGILVIVAIVAIVYLVTNGSGTVSEDDLAGEATGKTKDNYWKGYEIVTQEKENTVEVEFGCPDGKKILGGGCKGLGGPGALISSRPWSQADGWQCYYDDVKDKIIAYAICACVSEDTCSVSLSKIPTVISKDRIPVGRMELPKRNIPPPIKDDEFVDCAELFGAEYECWYNNWESDCDGESDIIPIPQGKCEVKTGGFENYCVSCQEETAACEGEVTFADPNLEQAVRDKINVPIGPILGESVQSVGVLYANSKNIADLSGIECLTNLHQLIISNNQISDLGPLKGLTKLTVLNLGMNQISNIEPLSGLVSLSTLNLYNNEIFDIVPLKSLTGLTFLNLEYNLITDISILSDLTLLKFLILNDNQINGVGALSSLTNLKALKLPSNEITDINPLSGLIGLDQLWLYDNPLSSGYCNVITQLEANGVDTDMSSSCP